ncbi:MAG: DHH family phosphoesterase [Bacillota bacterium]|jgi:phosphoesterase RecJ-like protein
MENHESLVEVLRLADRILIASHVNPDGDSIGTLIGLGLGLESLGKEVILVNSDRIPSMYSYLDGASRILRPEQVEEVPDTVVLVDCTDVERVGPGLAERLKKAAVLVNIDHHLSNSRFGHYNLVDEEAAATAEIVTRLLGPLKIKLNQSIATALYTGLVMDTGSFRYSNTTAATHRLAAYFLEQGVNLDQVRDNLFETRPLAMLRLMGEALQTLKTSPDGRLAWVEITQEMLDRTGARDEHCEELINYPRSVAGVKIGILFREVFPGKVKVGFRSKCGADVNKLAGQFGGGGHRSAAGCVINERMPEVVNRVILAAEDLLKQDLKQEL